MPSFLFVEFVAHMLGELLELSLRTGVVGIDHKVLKVPQPPAEILEPLALLEEVSDLCADLRRRSDERRRRADMENRLLDLPSKSWSTNPHHSSY